MYKSLLFCVLALTPLDLTLSRVSKAFGIPQLSGIRLVSLQKGEHKFWGHRVKSRAPRVFGTRQEALAHLARLADPDLISFHCAAAAACGTAHAWQWALQASLARAREGGHVAFEFSSGHPEKEKDASTCQAERGCAKMA